MRLTMKKFILAVMMCILFALPVSAQTIFSNGTGGGGWDSPGTWLGGAVPGANADVIIAGTDSVSTTTTVTCANLTVLSGGKLSTGIDSISVAGTFILESDAVFYNATTKSTVPGTVRELDPASTVVHIGSGTVGGAGNLEFGNLVIQRLEGCVPGGNLLVKGNLIINNNAANTVFRGVRPVTGSQYHRVMGDLIINRGTISCIDVGDNSMIGEWTIDGDVRIESVDARFSGFSSANAAGLAIYNIGGSIINNGGRMQAGTSSSAGPGITIINLKKNLMFNSGTFSTNSLGSFSINFKGNGVQTFYLRGVNVNLNTNLHDTIFPGSSVVMDLDTNKWGSATGGDVVVLGGLDMAGVSRLTGSGNFTLAPNGTLTIGSPDGIYTTEMLGSIQMIGTRTYSPEATYVYKGQTAQGWGNAFPLTLSGLTIANPNGMTLENDITVNSSLRILSGGLTLNDKLILLGPSATLVESAGATVKGAAGKIRIVSDLNAPSSLNVGGLGLMIHSGANLGSTTITRRHSPAMGGGNSGIARVYEIQPANNSGLNATIRFYYDESELNGIPEGTLTIFQSQTGADNSWVGIGGTVNTAENYVELSGVNDFAYLTMAGTGAPLPVEEESSSLPAAFELSQNFPNPFNPSTRITFALAEQSMVNLTVYNVLGQKVAVLVNSVKEAGYHQVDFDAANLSAGVYLYRLTAGDISFTRKMNLTK